MILRILSIVIQVTAFGVIVGAVVGVCSVGFVSGVSHISSWRDGYGSCLKYASSFCFSVQPIFFLLACACIILLVKKTLKIDRYHGPADVILSLRFPLFVDSSM